MYTFVPVPNNLNTKIR